MSRSADIDPAALSIALKKEALQRGFLACGIARAQEMIPERLRLKEWLNAGRHGSMSWMSNHFDKRTDPTRLVEGARSIISVLENYYHPFESSADPDCGRISRYAWGDDYHEVMKEKLHKLLSWLDTAAGGVTGRVFVDSAPVMDKAWAARAGLGWIGKHTNLIHPRYGSWFFIGELIVDTDLEPDLPIADHCGSCTQCVEACPTDALSTPYVLDASRCISYLTIEHHTDDITDDLAANVDNWIFGCDVCQDVCPWNKFRSASTETRYAPRQGILNTSLEEWEAVDEDSFRERFRKSPIMRTKFSGFSRNVRLARANATEGHPDRQPVED